jgi:hypothetical protein
MSNSSKKLSKSLFLNLGNLDQDLKNKVESGMPYHSIYLKEKQVFPHIIPAQPATARKSRSTGILFGRPTPDFIKMNRNIYYRLSDVMKWMSEFNTYSSTAHYIAG